VTDRNKMEGSCSTGQRTQWAVVPVEEEEYINLHCYSMSKHRQAQPEKKNRDFYKLKS
jgi:hypothetical protein